MSSAERAGRVQCLRTLLLGVLPVFTSYLLSHNGIDDFDPFRSFAAAFQSDLEQVLGVVRRHESTALLDGVDVLERIMGMLERFIDDEIPDQIGSTINDADYSLEQLVPSYPLTIRLFILARQHQGEDTNWFEDHQDFPTKEKKLRKKRELFEEYVRELKALGYSPPPDPSIALESKRSRPLPHVRKSVCALYHSLSRSLTCAVNVDHDESDDEDQHQVRLCLYVDGFHKVEMDNVAFELTVSTHHNGWRECRVSKCLNSTSTVASEERELVHSVCRELQRNTHDVKLHLLTNDNAFWLGTKRSTDCISPPAQPSHLVSVHDFLDQGQWSLNLQAKRMLMVVLARATVQLFDSPWLSYGWARRRIHFFSGYRRSERPDIRRPYIDSGRFRPSVDDVFAFYRNPPLVELGILLVEIESNKPIPVISLYEDVRCAHQYYDDCIRGDTYPWFEELIYLCLSTDPLGACSGRPPDHERTREKTREFLHRRIVDPLEADLVRARGGGTKLRDLDDMLNWTGNWFKQKGYIPPHGERALWMQSNEECFTAAETATDRANAAKFRPMYPVIPLPIYGGSFKLFDHAAQSTGDPSNYLSITKWFERYQTAILNRLPSKRSEVIRAGRVRIAILDSGIDRANPHVPSQRLQKVFNPCSDTEAVAIDDTCGHGTHVAALVNVFAPRADVYIAKITSDGNTIDDKALAKAFNHALDDWNVDIVIMSFGYHVRGLYRLFEEALSRARKFWPKKDVLLFAAASNEGGNSPRTYPARFDNVFCINSCDGNGDGSGFNPTPVEKEDNYCILGQDILAADPKVRVSGTSYAAPIAASLAASLIEFVGQNWPHADLVRGMQVMEDLQTHSGMRRILDGIAKKRNDYYYLCPWQELFNIESNPSNEEICRNIFKIVLC